MPNKPQVNIKSGRVARAVRDEGGRRVYGPFRVLLEVQLSPLAATSDTYEFFIYQSTGNKVIEAVQMLLKNWCQNRRKPYDGYPKPVGEGAAIPISDEEYRKIWQQAENSRRPMEKAGDQADPVAFFIHPSSTRIITYN